MPRPKRPARCTLYTLPLPSGRPDPWWPLERGWGGSAPWLWPVPLCPLPSAGGAVVFPRPLASLVSRPRAAVPWQRGLTLSPGKWGLSPGTRCLGPGCPRHEQTTALRARVWARLCSGWVLGCSRGQRASAFGRYCFVFNYTKFPDFILSYQRHRMLAHNGQRRTR